MAFVTVCTRHQRCFGAFTVCLDRRLIREYMAVVQLNTAHTFLFQIDLSFDKFKRFSTTMSRTKNVEALAETAARRAAANNGDTAAAAARPPKVQHAVKRQRLIDQMKGKGKKRMRMTKSQRAGLTFPVGRVVRHLREHSSKRMRITPTAGVYTAAILE